MPIVAGAVGAACFLVARRGAGDADRAAEQVEPDGGASRSTEAPATRVAPDHIDLDELVAVAGAISADGGAFSAGADAPEPASALRGVDAGRELDDASAAALLDVTIDRIDVLVSDGVLTPASEGPRRFHRTEILAARLAGG